MSVHFSTISVLSFRASIVVSVSLLLLAGCSQPNSVGRPIEKQAAHSPTTRLADQSPGAADGENTAPDFVSEPSPEEPVKVVMKFRPEVAAAGDVVELIAVVRIADAHYLHTAGDSHEPFQPVTISAELPDEIEPMGDWQLPPPIKIQAASVGYRDSIQLKRSLRVRSNAKKQTLKLAAELKYQACSDELCWPPTTQKLSAYLVIGSPLR